MKVKCIANKGSHLPIDCFNPSSGYDQSTDFSLIIGKEYVVYAITTFLGHIWYYVCDEDYTYYPIWNPSPLFEVVDGRISKYWKYSYSNGDSRDSVQVLFAYEEWINDPYYYDKLSNGEESVVATFKRYKKLMDIEYPNPLVSKSASELDDGWIMCPDCNESWEESSLNGMVECPKCATLLHNPLFREKS